ncbi:disease resistance-like protein DSC1 isoform X3 [Cannabis sativa]|uniref:disease resistance-like protein DSC1 isoform X3 n=1 Tax=Cannabis sativa TaxID=3483 RepID=UPI0029CA6582|nr:disease resistance-like protein DSC1 isoform X3 [Cannabis sativa]
MGAPISQLFQRFPGCKHLRELPNSICELESLEYLNLGGCVSFDKFPRLPKSIKGLDLSGTLIQKVEYSLFDCLPSVNVLYMQACKKLESLPATICKLKSLQVLNLEDCSQLKSFPEILEPMEKLKYLYLNRSGIEVLPSSIENLVMLETLSLSGCENLKSIPITICKLKFLRELYLGGCSQLKSFPEISEPMEKLEKLYLYGTGIEVLPSSIENLVMLNNLNLSECKNLKSIPTSMINMRNIDSIELDEYPQLQILPYNGLPVEDSSETSTSQLLLTHDQPYICSSCTYSTAILNLHYHGVDFTCCQCFLFYTIRNILAAQYFMDEIFIGKCRDGRVNDLIEAITQWFAHQSMGSSLQLNLPFSSPKDLRKYFLGFALCIVVEFEATTLKRDDVLTCKYNLKTKTGQNFQFYSIMQCQKATHFDDDDDDSNLDSSSNHQVFVGYLYRKDISMKRYAFYEEYYDFLLGEEESGIFEFHISKGTIKQCGVHLLYRQNIQLQDN